MKLEYDTDGNIKINIFHLLNIIEDDAKLDFIESLSCHEIVIKHVVDQILNGATENGFYGALSSIRSAPYTNIEKARREISKESSALARKEIQALEEALEKAEKEVKTMSDKYWDLYHARHDKT